MGSGQEGAEGEAFAEFFRRATGGRHPYAYQLEVALGPWPELLQAPTGAGKTEAVGIAWLWKRGWRLPGHGACRECACPDPETPRRLVWCLPMRVLVEQTANRFRKILSNLGILNDGKEHSEGGVRVYVLMGGAENLYRGSWLECPESDQILVGTQDILLSGALNRAYATWPPHWPLHFGLLNVDAFWVMDEIQLMGVGRTTSVQLQCLFDRHARRPGARALLDREAEEPPRRLRRTLWMSATLGEGGWAATPEAAEEAAPLRRLDVATRSPVMAGGAGGVGSAECSKEYPKEYPKTCELMRYGQSGPETLKEAIATLAAQREQSSNSVQESQQEPQQESQGGSSRFDNAVLSLRKEEVAKVEDEKNRRRRKGSKGKGQQSPQQEREGSRWIDDVVFYAFHQLVQRWGQKIPKRILFFVNTVRRAQLLYGMLQQYSGKLEPKPNFLLLHSRFRGSDRKARTEKLLEFLGRDRNQSGRPKVVVSTQVLEAGVDVEADLLVTELAPWPSLVQRFGRLNRWGGSPDGGKAIVVCPEVISEDYARPYRKEQLEKSREFLERLAQGNNMGNNEFSIATSALETVRYDLPLEPPVLREHHLEDLFCTDEDLSGSWTDVSEFVRSLEGKVDVFVSWPPGDHEGEPPEDRIPSRDDLCPVPFYELKKYLGGRTAWVLRVSYRHGGRRAIWREAAANEIFPGQIVWLKRRPDLYDGTLGWRASGVPPSKATDDGGSGGADGSPAQDAQTGADGTFPWHEGGIDDDPLSVRIRPSTTGTGMLLGVHLTKAENEARKLGVELGLGKTVRERLQEAAVWHDAGKALARKENGKTIHPFQILLRGRTGESAGGGTPLENDEKFYAKSWAGNWQCPEEWTEHRFRHEVASSLGYLGARKELPGRCADPGEQLRTSLVAYLIMAHHGKVRCAPQPYGDDAASDLHGVRRGDWIDGRWMARLPTPCAGILVPAPTVRDREGRAAVELRLERLTGVEGGLPWCERVAMLYRHFGPFVLAYLETLLRVSDWRASS